MLTSRLPRLFVLAALMSVGGEIARDGPASDFSALQEWKNQIAAELEHNKRYLPATRTRGKIGVVKFELNINRSGWVLPGTRIVTADPDLGRVALLLLQQSQPFPAPDNFKVPDSSFRIVASIGSSTFLLRNRRDFKVSTTASCRNVTRRIGRSWTISVEGRHIGTRRCRLRCFAHPRGVPRQSVRRRSASVAPSK